MNEIMDLMVSAFQNNKENGSYFLFYILALGLGLAIAWDRYVQEETNDNWMLEEAKKKIHLWPFLYGLLGLILVVANPLLVWVLNKISPIGGQYYKVWSVLLLLFVSGYAMVCFLSLLREQGQKKVLIVGFIVLIGLSGNAYGLMADRKGQEKPGDAVQVGEYLLQRGEDLLVLGVPGIIEYLGVNTPEIELLYGKDLYTPDMDLGIMDQYPEDFIALYEMMNEPGKNMEELTERASVYGCDYIIFSYSGELPGKAGKYEMVEIMGDYAIYGKTEGN